jgi:SAM-dependent methyltransferase
MVSREDLARRYLTGDGIEIGAATWPMRVPKCAHVRYVDRLPKDQLINEYGQMVAASGMRFEAIPDTDVVDDAETLATFPDQSVDFVIANHVLEHLEDPVKALTNMVRVLRTEGILFLSLPDRLESWDRLRPRTTVEHVLRDHREGPQVSRQEHYEEWARYIEGAADVPARAAEFAAEDARHHFHVWSLPDMLELVRALDLPAELELGQRNTHEFNVVLRRT